MECSIFHVFFVFDAISNIKEKMVLKKNPEGGGVCFVFMLFSTLQKKLKSSPSLTG